MNSSPAPRVSRQPAFPLIWVVPLVALLIGLWMGYRELYNRGPEITIEFADGSGVEANKTMLEFKGVSVGKVEMVTMKPGLDGVIIRLRLTRSAETLGRQGSQFWIVHPEIGFVTGVRLNVLPGTGAPAKNFRGLDKTPAPDVTDEGRTFYLQADKLGSLTTGAPVFFRELKVGAVEASRLSDDSTAVLIRMHIDAPYVDLVRTNSRFWNTGGFSFKVSLFARVACVRRRVLRPPRRAAAGARRRRGRPFRPRLRAGEGMGQVVSEDSGQVRGQQGRAAAQDRPPSRSDEAVNAQPRGDGARASRWRDI